MKSTTRLCLLCLTFGSAVRNVQSTIIMSRIGLFIFPVIDFSALRHNLSRETHNATKQLTHPCSSKQGMDKRKGLFQQKFSNTMTHICILAFPLKAPCNLDLEAYIVNFITDYSGRLSTAHMCSF